MGLGSDPLLGALEWLLWPLILGLVAGLFREFDAWRKQAASAPAVRFEGLAFFTFIAGLSFGYRAVGLLPGLAPDTFGGKEAAAIAAIGLGALWLGFLFAHAVWTQLTRLLPGLTVALSLWLLIDLGRDGSGILGNTGYDMQLLVPGAVIGLLMWSQDQRRIVGLLAFAGSAIYAALVPVLGAQIVFLVLATVALVRARAMGSIQRRRILGVFAVSLLLCAGRLVPLPSTGSATNQLATNSQQTGGLGVRLRIWKSLSAALPLTGQGFGPGQFQALYPPFRDPLEIEATTGGHTIEAITEVEHPHNDLLLVLAEGGWPRGFELAAALLAFAIVALRRQLSRSPGHDPALAGGALAMILMGAYHAPLFTNPAGAALGGLLLGALAGEGKGCAPAVARKAWLRVLRLGFVVVALAVAVAALAWRPVRLDDAAGAPELASIEAATTAAQDGRLSFDLIAAVARTQADPARANLWWSLALDLRPYSIEALSGRGLSHVQTGALLDANADWHAALKLDPAYPVVRGNLERLGADLILAGHLQPGLDNLASRLQRAGLVAPLLPRDLETLATTESPTFKTALVGAAAWLHGRELFETGSTSKALFELRRAAVLVGQGAAPKAGLGVEIAVLMSLEGQVTEARTRLDELAQTPEERQALIAELPGRLRGAARLLWK